MVFIHHYNPFDKEIFGSIVHDFFGEFYVGVAVFFVLSGFLIGYRYADTFEFSQKWFLKYVRNRVARIYPVYFLLTTITFLVGYLYGNHAYGNGMSFYFLNITFLKGFFDEFKFTGVAQGWSLTVEECFYFSAPVIFFLYKKYSHLYVQPLLLLLVGIALVLIFKRISYHGFFSSYKFMLVYTYFGRCVEFFIGIKLSLILRQRISLGTIVSKGSFYTIIGSLGITISLFLMVLVKGDSRFGVEHPAGILINNLIIPVFIAFFFYGVISENTIVSKFLRSKTLVLLGKSSYVFYLIHMGVIFMVLENVFPHLNNSVWGITIRFIVTNIFSIIIFTFFEEPVNKYLKSISFNSRTFKPS